MHTAGCEEASGVFTSAWRIWLCFLPKRWLFCKGLGSCEAAGHFQPLKKLKTYSTSHATSKSHPSEKTKTLQAAAWGTQLEDKYQLKNIFESLFARASIEILESHFPLSLNLRGYQPLSCALSSWPGGREAPKCLSLPMGLSLCCAGLRRRLRWPQEASWLQALSRNKHPLVLVCKSLGEVELEPPPSSGFPAA